MQNESVTIYIKISAGKLFCMEQMSSLKKTKDKKKEEQEIEKETY